MCIHYPIDAFLSSRGKEHKVYTGVCIFCKKTGWMEPADTFHCVTQVKFANLSDRDKKEYIKTREPFDKAGGYGIQEYGANFVESVSGCYYNVQGFPLHMISKSLAKLHSNGLC
eukprot:GHVU01068079.1.p2 GENE.GHVU01068079.1~~GHVU01068079.1.p2  ORF type:complete len:114 (-),score=11.03 GHVU01068079.1:941-1282(-)